MKDWRRRGSLRSGNGVIGVNGIMGVNGMDRREVWADTCRVRQKRVREKRGDRVGWRGTLLEGEYLGGWTCHSCC
jgi:hypothetical protein